MAAFEINPDNYLGIKYTEYLNKIEELAIRDTKTFFKMKNKMIETVKSQITIIIFNFVKNLLSTGKCGQGFNNDNFIYNGCAVSEAEFQPKYPSQEINNIALSLVQTINQFLDQHVCEILMPERIRSLVGKSITVNHPTPEAAAAAPGLAAARL